MRREWRWLLLYSVEGSRTEVPECEWHAIPSHPTNQNILGRVSRGENRDIALSGRVTSPPERLAGY